MNIFKNYFFGGILAPYSLREKGGARGRGLGIREIYSRGRMRAQIGGEGAGQPHLIFCDSRGRQGGSDNCCIDCYVITIQEFMNEHEIVRLLYRGYRPQG